MRKVDYLGNGTTFLGSYEESRLFVFTNLQHNKKFLVLVAETFALHLI